MNRLFIALIGGFFCQFLAGTWKPFPGHLRYDEVCHLTSHNSYAATEYGYLYAQQNLSLEKQFDYGVRGLMLDIGEEQRKVVLIHKSPFMTRLICRGKDPMPLQQALETIKKLLEQNPLEVITIFLENYVKDHSLLDKEWEQAGLDPFILTQKHWDFTKNGWPTFEWMRTNNKRLIIFNATGETTYCLHEWRHVVENQWGTLHPVKACKERTESKAWKHEQRSLYLLNYFPFFDLNMRKSYARINREGLSTFLTRILSHGLDTRSQQTLTPTFLCIDYVEIGDGLSHVHHINALKERERAVRS